MRSAAMTSRDDQHRRSDQPEQSELDLADLPHEHRPALITESVLHLSDDHLWRARCIAICAGRIFLIPLHHAPALLVLESAEQDHDEIDDRANPAETECA